MIEAEEKYDGFYAVATNLDDPAKDILEVSANRYKIEDCFRVMKTNFSARPVFHQKRERIINLVFVPLFTITTFMTIYHTAVFTGIIEIVLI